MGFRPVNIDERDFNENELDAIEALARGRNLSKAVSVALKQYLNNINPSTAIADNLEIVKEEQIDEFMKLYREEKPNTTEYVIKTMRENLKKKIADGKTIVINRSTFEMQEKATI